MSQAELSSCCLLSSPACGGGGTPTSGVPPPVGACGGGRMRGAALRRWAPSASLAKCSLGTSPVNGGG
jgi:hypothetical protein